MAVALLGSEVGGWNFRNKDRKEVHEDSWWVLQKGNLLVQTLQSPSCETELLLHKQPCKLKLLNIMRKWSTERNRAKKQDAIAWRRTRPTVRSPVIAKPRMSSTDRSWLGMETHTATLGWQDRPSSKGIMATRARSGMKTAGETVARTRAQRCRQKCGRWRTRD